MTVVLAIDHRVTCAAALVIDAAGEVLGSSERSVEPRHLPGGRAEQDPRELLAAVVGAGRAAVADAGVPIDVVALAPQGDCVLAWDQKSGQPLSNLIVRPDRRAEAIRANLEGNERFLDKLSRPTLSADHPAVKLAWLRRHITPDGVAGTADTWLLHQLTGELVTEISIASHSLLVDPDTLDWHPDLLELLGIADEQVPMVLPSDRIVGTTLAFGDTVLVGGVVDRRTSVLIGKGCLRPADATCALGSTADLLVNAGTTRTGGGLTSSVAWRVQDETTFYVSGQVRAAAWAIRWIKQLGLMTTFADLDRIAAPDAGGVLAVPAPKRSRVAGWQPEAEAHFAGMTRSTTVGHLVLAILQGVAIQIAALGSSMATAVGRPLSRLRVDGKLTTCTTLMQALADLMQLDVEVHPSSGAAAFGAAAVGRTAMNPALTLEQAVTPPKLHEVFTPRWSSHQADDFRSRWAKAADTA